MPRKKAPLSRAEQKQRGQAIVKGHLQEGRSKAEIFARMTQQNVAFMEQNAIKKGKCLNCWQSFRNGVCICEDLRPVHLTIPVHIIVWYHPRDWLCAGDDAKLLRTCQGAARTSTIIFGQPSDDARLLHELQQCKGKAVLLFPDECAITVDEFLQEHRPQMTPGKACCCIQEDMQKLDVGTPNTETAEGPAMKIADDKQDRRAVMTVLVLNGTWNNVRPILKHFNRCIDPEGHIPHVALKPDTLSVYQRAAKKNEKGVGADHICTVEAVALLLKECGETRENCELLVSYVELNAAALRGKRALTAQRTMRCLD